MTVLNYAYILFRRITNIGLIVIGLWAFFTNEAIGQTENSRNEDFEIWTGLNIKKKINKKSDAYLKFSYRRDDNTQDYKNSFVQVGYQYEIFKWLSLRQSYRFILNPNQKLEHRFISEARFEYKLKPIELQYKTRYEFLYENEREYINRLRHKWTISYKKKKLDLEPYLAFEVFHEFDKVESLLNKLRYIIGMEYEISKNSALELEYILQQEIQTVRPERDHIIGIGLNVKL